MRPRPAPALTSLTDEIRNKHIHVLLRPPNLLGRGDFCAQTPLDANETLFNLEEISSGKIVASPSMLAVYTHVLSDPRILLSLSPLCLQIL